jgi:spermidine synthase
LISFLVNAAGFVWSGKIEAFLEQMQFGNSELLYYGQSPYQRQEFVKTADGKIRFLLNGYNQFESGDWDAAYHESFAHPALSFIESEKKDISVLVLGSGDGLLLREIEKHSEVKKITIVDIDKEVIESAKNLDFVKNLNKDSFSDPRLKIVIDDAFQYVRKTKEQFDIVYIGFPTPSDYNLLRLYSKEFYFGVAGILSEDGVAVVQTNSYGSPIEDMVIKTLGTLSLNHIAYHPPEVSGKKYNFGFLSFSKKPIDKNQFTGQKIIVDTRWLNSANLKTIFANEGFGWHYPERPLVRVNSVFSPCLKCVSFFSPERAFWLKFMNNFRKI